MRFILALGLIGLLTSCASSTANHYTQTVQSWRGGNANNLVSVWGTPDGKIALSNGDTLYIYKTTSSRAGYTPTSPEIGVNTGVGGRAVITTRSNENYLNGNRGLSLNCRVVFEANAKGIIQDAKFSGNGCYGSDQFAGQYANPAAGK